MRHEAIKPLMAAMTLTLFAGSQALADTSVIELSPTQSVQIKEYVVKQKIHPVTMHENIVVGTTLPEDVELSPVPSDWGPSVSNYRYIYSSNRVVFVEPKSRRVIRIIE